MLQVLGVPSTWRSPGPGSMELLAAKIASTEKPKYIASTEKAQNMRVLRTLRVRAAQNLESTDKGYGTVMNEAERPAIRGFRYWRPHAMFGLSFY